MRFRRFIIKTAEIMMIVFVIITILASAISGALGGANQGGIIFAVIGLVVGAFLGLLVSAVAASFFFLVVEIAENTRRVLRYYEPDPAMQRR
jgi:uncharacterized membrane protein